jgi:GIY-YIG catalytic domain
MEYLLKNKTLFEILTNAQSNLFGSKKYKFEKSSNWRQTTIPNEAGVYALYEGTEKLIYVGETGNLRERMNEINRTVNHSFRKQLGANRFGGIKSKKKFPDDIEALLDIFFKEHLYVSFIEVNFGRLEIETFIIGNHQDLLLNSEKKRKKELKQILED